MKFFCSLVLSFLVAGCVHNPGSTTDRGLATMPEALTYETFDKDGNSQIDRAEYIEHIPREFEKADRNANGVLEKSELASGAWFAGADKNEDGKITLREFMRDAQRAHAKVDVNTDGRLDRTEFSALTTATETK